MARFYKPVDRDQAFLLPVSMREWLADDHLALFVVDLVATLDLSELHARSRRGGQGRAGYDPEMLLCLWVYAACTGVRSSRTIESRCRSDIAFRFICANRVPDHTTLARFRQTCDSVVADLFCQLLAVCAEAGLVSLGIVAIDGTKVAGNAGLGSNRGEDTIRAEVRKLLDAAAATDAAEDRLFGDRRGDELPDGLNKAGRERLVRLRAAAARVEDRKARAGKDAATQLAEFETKDAESMAATGLRRRGPKPLGPDPIGQAEQFLADARADHQRAKDVYAQAAREARAADRPRPSYNECNKRHMRVLSAEGRVARLQQAAAEGRLVVPEPPAPPTANITDPDSTVMPSVKGWMQGYNVQAAVNDQQLILAVDVVDTPNDVTQLEPMIAATRANLMIAGIDRGPGTILADAGYWSEANAAGPTSDDDDRPDRLIATTKSHKLRRQARERGEAKGPPPADATPLEAMEHRLRTPEGTALYAKRSITVEPVFGQLKERQRLRQFMRRGKPAVTAEATFAATTHNLLKLFTAGYRPAVAG